LSTIKRAPTVIYVGRDETPNFGGRHTGEGSS
jgi:hypothetical protein